MSAIFEVPCTVCGRVWVTASPVIARNPPPCAHVYARTEAATVRPTGGA